MADAHIVVLQGSPHREGNTAALVGHLADAARAEGATVEVFHLHDMAISPCTGCEGCHKEGADGCVIDDRMNEIYPKLRAADAIVFASPIYFFMMSAQLKTALDRCYALVPLAGESALVGKRVGLVFTYGAPDFVQSGCANAAQTFRDVCTFNEMDLAGVAHGSTGQGGIRDNREAMDAAADLGRSLAGG
ncbi:MAG: flavodoxin family protein [Phycisphaerae bacterium]